jgi:hypothetical protein
MEVQPYVLQMSARVLRNSLKLRQNKKLMGRMRSRKEVDAEKLADDGGGKRKEG